LKLFERLSLSLGFILGCKHISLERGLKPFPCSVESASGIRLQTHQPRKGIETGAVFGLRVADIGELQTHQPRKGIETHRLFFGAR